MTLSNCYTTVSDVAYRLGLEDADEDLRIEQAITPACRAIDAWCGQFFYDSGAATALNIQPTDPRVLRTDPFSTSTGLVIKTDLGGDGSFSSTWSATDYELLPGSQNSPTLGTVPYNQIHAVTGLYFPMGMRRRLTVQVTARWGWASVPSMVEEAAKILAVDLWKRKDTPFGIASATADFGGLRIGRDAMSGVASILQPFKRLDTTGGFA